MTLYAIVGATGKVGLATATALRQAGLRVRAIQRDVSKASKLQASGCEIVEADLLDPQSLVRALEGADCVQVIIPLNPASADPAAEMRRSIENIAHALDGTKPQVTLVISDYGAHQTDYIGIPSIFNMAEETFRRCPGHKIFLRSAEHMENWAQAISAAQRSGTLASFHAPIDSAYPMVSAQDVGRKAAHLLQKFHESSEGVSNTIRHIEGPARYSALDVVHTLSDVLGKTIQLAAIDRSEWDGVLKQHLSPALADLLSATNEARNKGGLVEVEPGSDEVIYGGTTLRSAIEALLIRTSEGQP